MAAIDSLTLRVQAEQIAAASSHHIGRPPVITDPDKVQLLLACLSDGNYRETALKVAGIGKQTFYNALKRAEQGDAAAIAFVDAVENAEANSEAGIVKAVRNAALAGPQYWAAGITLLERTKPDRFGRRPDDQSVPKVVVQIGASVADVQVHVHQQVTTSAGDALASGDVLDVIEPPPVRRAIPAGDPSAHAVASEAPVGVLNQSEVLVVLPSPVTVGDVVTAGGGVAPSSTGRGRKKKGV